MKLEHIDYLLTVLECGSIYKAAQKLYMQPQHLRQILNALEDELGVKILVRDKKNGCYLTDVGEQLIDELYNIKSNMDQIKNSSKALLGKYSFPENNSLNIYANTNVDIYLFKGLLELQRIYKLVGKNLCINYFEEGAEKKIEKFLSVENTVAQIITMENENIEDIVPKGLKWIELGKFPWCAMVSANNPVILEYNELSIQDILKMEHVLYVPETVECLPTYNFLEQFGDVKIAFKTSNSSMFYNLLGSGKYIYIGGYKNKNIFSRSNIIEVPIKEKFNMLAYLIYRPEFEDYTINRWLLDYWRNNKTY